MSIGADHGVVADGSQVEQVLELTGGNGAEVVIDFVGEGGATGEGVRMLAARRRLPRRRLRREHQRAHDRHHLHRDQLHRQPGRVLQRPVRPDGARRAGRRAPAHRRNTGSTTSSPPSTTSTRAMSAAEPSSLRKRKICS